MLQEFRSYIGENGLINENDQVLMAVSGGIDSMVMSHLFLAAGISTAIAHCNFNLRGRESDGDELFVRKYSEKNKIPFHFIRFDTTGYADEKGISIQMAARELRYRWFEEIRSESGYSSIALAHNLNDNVETFLINLTRGTGIAGLTGMRPRFNHLIRPMLFASRKAITEYADLNKVRFREDRSNSDTKYARNKIRHSIIPIFREINPSFDSTIIETAERLGEVNDIVADYVSAIKKESVRIGKGSHIFRINDLRKGSSGRTVLFELFRPYGLASAQLDELEKIMRGKSGNLLITKTHLIRKNRSELIVSAREENTEVKYIVNSVKDFMTVPGITSAAIKSNGKQFRIPASSSVAALDAAKVEYPVTIRKWKPGDHFHPLGMKTRKKLSDHFIDRKYSVPDKEKQLILETGGKIAWVIGDRIDDRFKVTDETRKVLLIGFGHGSPGRS